VGVNLKISYILSDLHPRACFIKLDDRGRALLAMPLEAHEVVHLLREIPEEEVDT